MTVGYRINLMEQIPIILGIVEFNAPAPASGETSVLFYPTAIFLRVRCARRAFYRNL